MFENQLAQKESADIGPVRLFPAPTRSVAGTPHGAIHTAFRLVAAALAGPLAAHVIDPKICEAELIR